MFWSWDYPYQTQYLTNAVPADGLPTIINNAQWLKKRGEFGQSCSMSGNETADSLISCGSSAVAGPAPSFHVWDLPSSLETSIVRADATVASDPPNTPSADAIPTANLNLALATESKDRFQLTKTRRDTKVTVPPRPMYVFQAQSDG
jgi:hypothetical protein